MSTAGDEERALAAIALSHLLEPGHRQLAGWIAALGVEECWRRLLAADLGQLPVGADRGTPRGRDRRARDGDGIESAMPPAAIAALRRRPAGELRRSAERDLSAGSSAGARLVLPGDAEWPQAMLGGLDWLDDPADSFTAAPICLWLRGPVRLDEAVGRSVAVVGARASTPYGDHVATELGFGLAERSWAVVSGGAYGIDGAAHRGALAGDGVTVAVLATGVDQCYPRGHSALFERIADTGLLVSELPPGAQPRRRFFLVRNRLIAALTAGTVVVEAAVRSGARMTARRAEELGRQVGAVPGPVTSAMSTGCHALIRSSGAVLVTNAGDVVDLVGDLGVDAAQPLRAPAAPIDDLEGADRRILDAVPSRRWMSADEIATRAAASAVEVYRRLPALVAARLVEERQGRYRMAKGAPDRLARPPVDDPRLR